MNRHQIKSESITPISEQLRLLLLREIEDGHFAVGSRIPSERDMAERYGVSRTSVRDCIGKLISEKVLMRSKRRGTFVAPPPFAGGGHAAHTGLIGYLVSKALMEFFQSRYHRILSGAEEILHPKAYQLVFHSCGEDHRSAVLKGLHSGGRLALDGCIVAGRARRETLETLRAAGVPTVVVDRDSSAGDLVSVQVDYARGTRLAMEHLRELGHVHIGFIGFADSQKYRAYCEAVSGFRIPHDPKHAEFLEIFDLPPAILAGYQTTQRMIASGRLPTALLVTNDLVAVGVMEALRISGLRVPEDVSVVGFDDLGQNTTPSLTRIRADLTEMGRVAADCVIKRIEKQRLPDDHLMIPIEFVIAGSTAVPAIRMHQKKA